MSYVFQEYPKYLCSVDGRDIIANDRAHEEELKNRYMSNVPVDQKASTEDRPPEETKPAAPVPAKKKRDQHQEGTFAQ